MWQVTDLSNGNPSDKDVLKGVITDGVAVAWDARTKTVGGVEKLSREAVCSPVVIELRQAPGDDWVKTRLYP